MKKIINTSKEEVSPEWLLGGNPEAIEAQEKRGQEQLISPEKVHNELMLPIKILDGGTYEDFGIKFKRIANNDTLFAWYKVPAGYKVLDTEHAMWSKLVDGTGKEIGSIFYKAAFYDRRAFINFKKEKP